MNKTIGELLDFAAEEYQNQLALKYHRRDIAYTYRQLQEKCNQLAQGLMALGIKKGDRVAVWANNVPEWVIAQYATAKIGAILVTVNTAYRSFELEYLLNKSGASTLILIGGVKRQDDYTNILYEVVPELKESQPGELNFKALPNFKNVIYIGAEDMPGMFSWQQVNELGQNISLSELKARQDETKPEEVINLQFTSGTTGFPKGVMLTHNNIVKNAAAAAAIFQLSPNDCLCMPLPFYHCYGCVTGNLSCLVAGAALAPVETFKPQKVLEVIEKSQCTAMHGVPTMYLALLRELERCQYDLSSLQVCILGGSICPENLVKQVRKRLAKKDTYVGYGQTESSPVITLIRNTDPLEKQSSTIGRALPGVEVKIIDPETQKELLPGQNGELCTRGYHVMKGYYNLPEETAKVIDEQGWLHTGDLAQIDEDGFCKITGRIKDMIICGGENIYPQEIESFFYTMPKVRDVQVVGVPSRYFGEEVAAFIILKDNQESTVAEMKEYCKHKVARNKIPRYIYFVSEYPMTANGKVQKYKLRKMAEEKTMTDKEGIMET